MCDATTDNYKIIKTTGNYVFEKTYFNMDVGNIGDSAFVQVTHNWAPPDSLKSPVAGLRLSDYRYWRIDGILPEGFEATGKFTYNINSFLDNTLITSSTDTLIILFRENASEDWQEIDFEKIGPWNVGNIVVENLQPGEYTLAVKEAGVGSYEPVLPKKNAIEVCPNPSDGGFIITLKSGETGKLRIYNESGILVKSFAVEEGDSRISWMPERLAAGTYLVMLVQDNKQTAEIEKIIYLK